MEFHGEGVPFSNTRCTESTDLYPVNLLVMDYSVDGEKEQHAFSREPLRIEARQYVNVSIAYCNTPRVRAFVDGRPYELSCEHLEQYIGNDSKCARIQIEPQEPVRTNTQK